MVIYYLIIINYQCAFFLCNNNYDKEHVRSDDLKHAQKAPSLPHSKPKWYSYPTAPVECGCRATWSELGDISEGEKTDKPAVRKSVRKTGKHSKRRSVCR